MATTWSSSDVAAMIKEHNDATLIPRVTMLSPITKCADVEKFPEQQGNTVYLHQWIPPALVTGSLSSSVEHTDPTPVVVGARKFGFSLYTLMNSFNPSRFLKKTSFTGLKDLNQIVAENMAQSIELHNITMIVPRLIHFRADWDNTTPNALQVFASDTGSTTTMVSSTLSQADDYWAGSGGSKCYVIGTGFRDNNFGRGTMGTDFANSGDTLTFDAIEYAPVSGEKFMITRGDGLTTGDKATVASIGKAKSVIAAIMNDTLPKYLFSTAKGQGLRIFVSEGDKYDLMNDSSYQGFLQYNAKSDGFQDWRVGVIYNDDVMEYHNLYRESTIGAYSATGAVYNVIALGKHCLTMRQLTPPRTEIVGLENADSGNLLKRKLWYSWETEHVMGVTQGCAGYVLMTVPTNNT